MIEKEDCDEYLELSMRHSESLTSKAYPPMLREIHFSKHASCRTSIHLSSGLPLLISMYPPTTCITHSPSDKLISNCRLLMK
jgi:hypothetical protein